MGRDWIFLAQKAVVKQAVLNEVIELRVPRNAVIFLKAVEIVCSQKLLCSMELSSLLDS